MSCKEVDVLVIGGGVIGVCSAYYLAAAGVPNTLVERGDICSGCSYGNAGLLAPSHSVPLAAPGAIKKALKWMWDPVSPFYVRPRLDWDLAAWLWSFSRACKDSIVSRHTPLLRDLLRASLQLYRELSALPGLDFGFCHRGLLTLFRTGKGYEAGLREADLLSQAGIEVKVLAPAEAGHMEPVLSPAIAGAMYFPEDAHLNPADFVRGLADQAEKRGARICPRTEVIAFDSLGGRIAAVRTTRGDFRPREVVLAAGAWSPLLARNLSLKLPVQSAKGYSVTLKASTGSPAIPLLFSEAKVIAVPLAGALRFAGTLELAGLDLSMSLPRVEAVRRAPAHYLQRNGPTEVVEIWRGLRPCTPDGLPILGRSKDIQNLIVATGHAMLGMSLGPVTGRLISELVLGDRPMIDIDGLRPERFC